MKTFSLKISAHSKRTRAGERQATAHIVRGLTFEIPESRLPQAWRIIEKLRAKETPQPVKRGQFSGLTHAELAATGTCETDWY